jgi:Protein of unknown function (DUF664)
MCMSTELHTYTQELRWILDQISRTVDGLTEQQLKWRPATGTANSVYAIASHVVGSTRVYALGFGCGRRVTRDRSAELVASGSSSQDLVTALGQLADEITTALTTLPAATLDERLRPTQELWGTGQVREISRREALVESIRHAALHLGELRLTRDLARQDA